MIFHSYSSQCPFKSVDDIKDKHITIMGLGLNGGGEATARFFLQKGAFVTVTDMKSPEQLAPTIERLDADDSLDHSRLTYHLGGHDLADFENAAKLSTCSQPRLAGAGKRAHHIPAITWG